MTERLHLFDAFGVELEYMIVDRRTLDVRAITDNLIHAESGLIQSEFERGDISWSNELALHVVELKTTRPAPQLTGLADLFQENIVRANEHLQAMHCRLLPSAMHPWMNPFQEMKLWPHEYNEVYEAFNRVFDCRGHGWANLQSVHLNLPFCGDEEFGRLHAAVRLILPLLPGLAASSPVIDGKLSQLLDTRLEVYRNNSRRVPMVAGRVIPEPAFTQEDYDRQIFQPLYAQIAELDPDGVLREEFLNARGAIARFERGSIEIRVIDIQECPAADLAVLQTTIAALKALVAEMWSTTEAQRDISVDRLYNILLDAIRSGGRAVVADVGFLKLFGVSTKRCTISELWQQLVETAPPQLDARTAPALETILKSGPLARRIINRLNGTPTSALPKALHRLYDELAECLASGTSFAGGYAG
ncbi:MAG: glutamate-cysteine ligase family protein [Planctomycetaceae bacterium]